MIGECVFYLINGRSLGIKSNIRVDVEKEFISLAFGSVYRYEEIIVVLNHDLYSGGG